MSRFDHRELDRPVHSRIRLAALAILAGVEEAEFTYLRNQVNTTDGNLALTCASSRTPATWRRTRASGTEDP